MLLEKGGGVSFLNSSYHSLDLVGYGRELDGLDQFDHGTFE